MRVKIGKNETELQEPNLEGTVLMWAHRKQEIARLEAEMESYKQTIIKAARENLQDSENATVTFLAGDFSVKTTFAWDIKIDNPTALKGKLGKRFDDLVRQEIVYKPEAKLKEIILKETELKEFLAIKEKAPSVVLEKKA